MDDKRTNDFDDNEKSTSSPNSNSSGANAGDDLLPAFYAPSSIFPTSVTNKIDLSTSVSQYLHKEGSKKTDSYVTKQPDTEPLSDTNNDGDSTGSRSPQQSHRNPTNSFEFFSRQIPETNHPAPQALDEKASPSIDYDSASDVNVRNSISPPAPVKPIRKSIYEMSSDDEDNDDGEFKIYFYFVLFFFICLKFVFIDFGFLSWILGDKIRSPSDGDNDDSQDSRKPNAFSLSKDKDMRISAFLMEKDFSNGDIDLRMPFKPVMANYIPATEIDASITSHAPIAYLVSTNY